MKVAIVLKAPFLDVKVEEDHVIYADAGFKFKDQIGDKNVIAVVGDFDSLKQIPSGQNVVKLDEEKNFTDGERAVILAKELGYKEIVIYGAYGGKIEHVLGNIALLKIAKNIGVKAVIKDANGYTELIDGVWEKQLIKSSTLSLVPYGGDCEFYKSSGLYYPLDGLTLTTSDTRGISNKTIDTKIVISIKDGEALVIYK